ncbi:MAG: regulatory protein GemA [Rhodospirillales bacterium]|nr:regulatory protein GemA [Rhodospirillales bacterium]
MPLAVKKQAAKKPVNPFRKPLYAKINIAKKELGLDEETYRDILTTNFGKDSLKKFSNAQLSDLITHFKELGFKPKKAPPKRAGRKKLADGPTQMKARALWLSLYHLGIISDPSEQALDTFVKRQVKVDAINFMTPSESHKVIEALKKWATREGGVDWSAYASTSGLIELPRARVMEAQWEILHKLGDVMISDTGALTNWVCRFLDLPGRTSYCFITDEDADRVIEALGRRIRKVKADLKKAFS